jgi:Na+-translocating ferredoxin:NAD+ oxidoreductase RNF subunit RnfB
METFEEIVYVCDLCGGSPKCTEACTEDAITFVKEQAKPVSLAEINREIKNKKLNSGEKRANYIEKLGKSLVKKWRG